MREIENHTVINIQIAPKYYSAHEYLTFCNDTLVSILRYADQHNLVNVEVSFNSKQQAEEFEKIEATGNDWHQWMLENGYKDQMYTVYYRHTLFSLVADFCHYMLESINCAAKMKVAVSYALLRKPVKDTLGFIEWLKIDRNEMIDLLVNGPANALEIKFKAEYISRKIREVNDQDNYFEFRYSKESPESLERIWNKANHLVTNAEYWKTPKGTLNFVYADESILQEHTQYYYLVVPLIMKYAVDLVVSMFEEFTPLNDYTKAINAFIRAYRAVNFLNADNNNEIMRICAEANLPILCPRCRKKVAISQKSIKRIIGGKFICRRCFKLIKTNRYIFDWEKLEIEDVK
jgi:hypothetical protein